VVDLIDDPTQRPRRAQRKTKIFLLGVLCVLGVDSAWPLARADADSRCTLVVDARGSTPYRSIQAAIDALPNPGPCEVVVRAGTYRESVVISGKNSLASQDGQRIRIVGDEGATVHATGDHGFVIADSTRIDVEGFVVTGAAAAAIVVAGGDRASHDVTLARNDLHNNGSPGADGGVLVESGSVRTWVVNNLIRQNGRNGFLVRRPATAAAVGSTYAVNNTIFGQGWNGVSVDRDEEVVLINNLIVGNGTDRGTAGGRWGVVRENALGGAPASIVLRNNVVYRNGGARDPSDIGNAEQILDESDGDNLTTSGLEGTGVTGCAVAECLTWPFSALFAGNGYGPRFRLAAESPAIGKGLGTFTRDGREWVPAADADGTPRTPNVDVGRHQVSGRHP
jgi:hypothetical protein